MSGIRANLPSTVNFKDFATVLALMRTATKQQCDLGNARTLEFYEALEIAWTAAMLLNMEADEPRELRKADAA